MSHFFNVEWNAQDKFILTLKNDLSHKITNNISPIFLLANFLVTDRLLFLNLILLSLRAAT